MVRVGGGWDTLEHYLDKHDPCRCSSGKILKQVSFFYSTKLNKHCNISVHAGHRGTIASKFIMKGDAVTPRMKVEYERYAISNSLFKLNTNEFIIMTFIMFCQYRNNFMKIIFHSADYK